MHWISAQSGPGIWTYALQAYPLDNLNVSQASTTITMTGLSGVTAAGAPTSTDNPIRARRPFTLGSYVTKALPAGSGTTSAQNGDFSQFTAQGLDHGFAHGFDSTQVNTVYQ